MPRLLQPIMELVYEANSARGLRLVLKRLAPGASVSDTLRLEWLLGSLESFLPEVLQQVFDWWEDESLDGIYPFWTRKTRERELEFFGTCILITDQTNVLIHV